MSTAEKIQQPNPPYPAQKLEQPGLEADLRLKPRFEGKNYLPAGTRSTNRSLRLHFGQRLRTECQRLQIVIKIDDNCLAIAQPPFENLATQARFQFFLYVGDLVINRGSFCFESFHGQFEHSSSIGHVCLPFSSEGKV